MLGVPHLDYPSVNEMYCQCRKKRLFLCTRANLRMASDTKRDKQCWSHSSLQTRPSTAYLIQNSASESR